MIRSSRFEPLVITGGFDISRRKRDSGRRLRSLATDERVHVAMVGAACAAVTVVFALLPSLQFGYRTVRTHVSLETAATLVSSLAAFLVFGRLSRDFRLPTLLLACGLGGLAITNLLLSAFPLAFHHVNHSVALWGAVGGRLGAAIVIAASVVASRRGIRRRVGLLVISASVLLAVIPIVGAWLLRSEIPPVAVASSTLDARHPYLDVEPAYLAVQAIEVLLYGVAAIGFAQKAMRQRDGFLGWLSIAFVVAAFSRFNYLLYPSLYTDWVYLGDFLRLAFFFLLLVAALREIAGYWRAAASVAAVSERRRLARDLHDGVAQEIAFLRSTIPSLAKGNRELASRVAEAARRAEHESRELLATLVAPSQDELDTVLASALDDVASREMISVDLDTVRGIRVDQAQAEALLRIAMEAVTNSARHGGVKNVRVRLDRSGERIRLTVKDGGVGFDPAAVLSTELAGGDGFGLSGMRGRAAAVGADIVISSRPGRGTEVIVTV